jgi:hypothetical protein
MAVLPTATSVLPEASGGTGTTTGYYGFKNRIINGAMVIDQRNAGASVTQTTTVQYPVDRMQIFGDVASKFTGQQSTTVPSGFINSLKITSSSAYTVGAGERFFTRQAIEGLNCTDLDFGKATAKPITVSFWVYSSLTGSFGGAIQNLARDRSYPFSYTISSANTWEQKSVSIAGDTTGTWLTSNDVGLYLTFSMGAGTTYSTTANAWAAGNYIQPTGSTSVVGTSGATFYITGVQLEKGSTATSFDYRPYGTELSLCQRYYYKNFPALSNSNLGSSFNASTTQISATGFFPVQMRARPTALEQTGTASDYVVAHRATSTACSSVPTYDSVTNQNLYTVVFTVSSGLTAGDGSQARTNSTSGFLAWSAEL